MVIITREQLLTRKTKSVELPIGIVKIRQLSAGEYAESVAVADDDDLPANSRFVNQAAFACAHALVEPTVDPDNWKELLDLPMDVLGDLFEAVNEFSGMGAGDEQKEVDQRVAAFPAHGGSEDSETVHAHPDGPQVELPADAAG